MKLPSLLGLLLILVPQASAQQVYAIVTVAVTNPTDDNARFVIALDTNNAPRSVAQLKMLADPGIDYHRNGRSSPISNRNPSGFYSSSNEDGDFISGGGETYTVSINGNTNPAFSASSGATAVVVRSGTNDPVAILRRQGNSWVHQKGRFDAYDFSVSYNSQYSRYILNVETDAPYLNETTGGLSREPFYENRRTVAVVSGSHPYLSMGERSSGANTAPGWLLQNEIINANSNALNSTAIFGNHFANAFGNVTASQTYAVAFANSSFTEPNTATSRLWVTGQTGNPTFEGRQTYIGTVVSGNYQNSTVFPNTFVSGSRALVNSILGGSRRPFLKSIDFESIRGPYLPIADLPTIPVASLAPSQPTIDCASATGPRLFSGSSRGQIRLIERSSNLQLWSRAGQSNFPSSAIREVGFAFDSRPSRQFFRVNPFVVTYPSWPSALFIYNSKEIRFQGRALDSSDGPQVLNDFLLDFGPTGGTGTLTGEVGDLKGSHALFNVEYAATSPFQGELSMESSTLPATLKLRLYFDAHKPQEYDSNVIIDRFHRIIPTSSNPLAEEKGEFGLWQIQ